MNEPKYGDIIEVNGLVGVYDYHDRIFIGHGKHGGVVCVSDLVTEVFSKHFREGVAFQTTYWAKWRIKKQPEYRAFKKGEEELLIGKAIQYKEKDCNLIYIIIAVQSFKSYTSISVKTIGEFFDAEHLLRNYTFLDESLCGVRIQ